MQTLVTLEDRARGLSRLEIAFKNPSSVGDITPPAPGVSLELKATAIVSGGRWIAKCPADDCNGAEYVSFIDPFIFCHECRNAQVGHLLIAVELPTEAMRANVEKYLMARPSPMTRNWEPGDTVKKLRDENREHGIRLS